MNETQEAEVLPVDQSKGDGSVPAQQSLSLVAKGNAVTPAQAKVDAIAALTMSAYAKASELKLTQEEADALRADFPDEDFQPGAAGKENLLYIQHAALRDRFTKVLGMGGWAIVPRSRWSEEFTTTKGVKGVRVYVEAMLMVRGCFVGESIGDMDYYPGNQSTNYGDSVEGAKTAAFRRCAKEFGVGLQAWRKEWGEGWWRRKNAPRAQTPKSTPVQSPKDAPAASQTPNPSDKSQAAAEVYAGILRDGKAADKALLARALEYGKKCLVAYIDAMAKAVLSEALLKAHRDGGDLLPNEGLGDLKPKHAPLTSLEFKERMTALQLMAKQPAAPPPEVQAAIDADEPSPGDDDESWRSFPMPFGKNAGKTLGSLPKNYLFGLWANHTVETEDKGKPKKQEWIEKDQEFRDMLDLAGAHYGFTKDDEESKPTRGREKGMASYDPGYEEDDTPF